MKFNDIPPTSVYIIFNKSTPLLSCPQKSIFNNPLFNSFKLLIFMRKIEKLLKLFNVKKQSNFFNMPSSQYGEELLSNIISLSPPLFLISGMFELPTHTLEPVVTNFELNHTPDKLNILNLHRQLLKVLTLLLPAYKSSSHYQYL